MRLPSIPVVHIDPSLDALRSEVRAFLEVRLARLSRSARASNWQGVDPEFSRDVGAKGWIGMTWPRRYGGHERSALERYVVTEELLAGGAPVRAHWIGDRQTGPMLLKYGSEEQRVSLLPRIVRGEVIICAGMSEPNAGSDLASVRCRATRMADGWLINGSKLWTSLAHLADYMVALLRTNTDPESKHRGLSQFLIDMRTPGIKVRTIVDLRGHPHLNQVFFDDVLLPHDSLIGYEGDGWKQVTHELTAFERSGPERYLSSIQLLIEMLNAASADNERQSVALGRLVAELITMRNMSLGVSSMLGQGDDPSLPATIVKDLGSGLEQHIPDVAHDLFGVEPGFPDSALSSVLGVTERAAPSSSLRGGTREILRGIIARALDLR